MATSHSKKPAARKGRNSKALWQVGLLFVLLGVLVVGWLSYKISWYQEHTVTTTICSKERSAVNYSGEYRVYTADSGTYVIKDMHWPGHFRFNSADVYGELRHLPGTYNVTFVGWRAGIVSYFPNIVRFERVSDDPAKIASCS
jgi:hypothetical protein